MEMSGALTLAPVRSGAGGWVALVGTGPGDPELLTLRALRRIEQAEVALYDSLVAPEVLDLLPRSAERIYVGKRRNNHSMRQEDISALMVERARRGHCVVRLKGGDPFVFGRGGEEVAALAAANIPFEVVPGITAAIGACAYAAIPLTHRDCAQACTFVTGQLQNGSIDLDWPALARPRQTVVVYMGLLALPLLCAKLIEHGRSPQTPAAIIQEATRPGQRVLVGTLASLPTDAARAGLRAPTVIVVGEVVGVRQQLEWYTTQVAGD
ncbi:MAG TPA: uroporphyrinogen-III C-methyltransferase [Burkholderiaceae bacterium]|nr:uroporphyrinogen-III C-methyltransferase [Burkholderiaceae bacterium]